VVELGRALVEDDSSALLRHEVAYVLGQLQHPAAVPALAASLARVAEHRMVRHESAEALGAIEFDDNILLDSDPDGNSNGDGGGGGAARDALLQQFADPALEADRAVRESCEVALDAADYWHMFSVKPSHADAAVGGVGAGQSFAQQKAASDLLAASHFNIAPSAPFGG
jgi:deoxyhypusine monooxygenase